MTDAVITYTDEDTGTVFRWHGGAYIEVGTMQPAEREGFPNPRRVTVGPGPDYVTGLLPDTGPMFVANDVINVWDYERDMSRLEIVAETVLAHQGKPFRRVLELFEERCRQYLADAYDDEGVDA